MFAIGERVKCIKNIYGDGYDFLIGRLGIVKEKCYNSYGIMFDDITTKYYCHETELESLNIIIDYRQYDFEYAD